MLNPLFYSSPVRALIQNQKLDGGINFLFFVIDCYIVLLYNKSIRFMEEEKYESK